MFLSGLAGLHIFEACIYLRGLQMLGPACIIIGQSVYIFEACGSLHIPSRPAYDLAACRLSSGRPGLDSEAWQPARLRFIGLH